MHAICTHRKHTGIIQLPWRFILCTDIISLHKAQSGWSCNSGIFGLCSHETVVLKIPAAIQIINDRSNKPCMHVEI